MTTLHFIIFACIKPNNQLITVSKRQFTANAVTLDRDSNQEVMGQLEQLTISGCANPIKFMPFAGR